MNLNLRVLIEARGFIRLIQLVMAIVAFATTASFKGSATFDIVCREFEKTTQYKFGYPFKMEKNEIRAPDRCSTNISDIAFKTYAFPPFDFSCSAELFVAAGVLSLMYAGGVVLVYVFMQRLYSTNKIIPVVDLVVTNLLSILWLVVTTAWVLMVFDIEHYFDPTNFFQYLDICKGPKVCRTTSLGDFTQLYVSLIFGIGNCLLWICSLWFVYRETHFRQQVKPTVKSPEMEEQQAPPMPEKNLKL